MLFGSRAHTKAQHADYLLHLVVQAEFRVQERQDVAVVHFQDDVSDLCCQRWISPGCHWENLIADNLLLDWKGHLRQIGWRQRLRGVEEETTTRRGNHGAHGPHGCCGAHGANLWTAHPGPSLPTLHAHRPPATHHRPAAHHRHGHHALWTPFVAARHRVRPHLALRGRRNRGHVHRIGALPHHVRHLVRVWGRIGPRCEVLGGARRKSQLCLGICFLSQGFFLLVQSVLLLLQTGQFSL
mmetsp:Transcript_34201/g.72832  ORF Transcript_34201/g.72832 Transcript_34201/m.72832 type:complete len:240 (+) Transcript_34201:319-1038(+)